MNTKAEAAKMPKTLSNSRIINGIALGFSLAFLVGALTGALYTGEWGHVFQDWYLIMISPCPLVTDYFALGGLASTMLNAGACGLACFFFMIFLKGESRANTLAGYFLVVAHCFYGLNFLNMWPCFLATFVYLRFRNLDYKKNLHICMFATSFGPFISELLFRYTQGHFVLGEVHLTLGGILLTAAFSLMLGFLIPAVLPGAHAWHKGYTLFNGGLAVGLLGFFLFNFLYRTMGFHSHGSVTRENPIYQQFGHSYGVYANLFFLCIFLVCLTAGWYLNGKSFDGMRHLVKDTGYSSDFADKYGMPLCLINIACHGSLFLLYLNLSIHFTEGSGFTGPTVGVVFAALTFTAMGQHPKNVWPILFGYQLLSFVVFLVCTATGNEIPWSLSTQGYITSAAFATGLCPIVGRYGIRAGIAAGFMCASLCTSTSALHGGLILYNGGFTTGVTALILLPVLEHYIPDTRDEIRHLTINMRDMLTLIGNTSARPEEKIRK